MPAIDVFALLASCAPLVAPDTAHALITVESRGNPHAIAVVGGSLQRQPRTQLEAVATARALQARGLDFSAGLGQINRRNFDRYGLTIDNAFDPCTNLRAMQAVLSDCFERAPSRSDSQAALRQALSCYYSGNFRRGYVDGYVGAVAQAAIATQARKGRKERPASSPS